MKAAVITGAGCPPEYRECESPAASDGNLLIKVSAAALSPIARSRASGTHYSSKGDAALVAGVDGVGTLPGGERVYFVFPEAPYGSMAEFAPVKPSQCIPLPPDLDEAAAAAMAIPGMSSWAALKERAFLKPGETVLVNGATGTSGSLAVQIARHLGAGKVIATGRNAEALDSLPDLGADAVIPLSGNAGELERRLGAEFGEGIDVVLDYLWGESAEKILVAGARNGKDGVPIRFIQIGSAGGADIRLPGAALRSSALELRGSGIGSIPFPRLFASLRDVLAAAPSAGFKVRTRSVPLSDVGAEWNADGAAPRIVFRMG
jgi:NADPH:quinone reductase-like Zn-dependent oxidoreductase